MIQSDVSIAVGDEQSVQQLVMCYTAIATSEPDLSHAGVAIRSICIRASSA
jgi:hypothetical protein